MRAPVSGTEAKKPRQTPRRGRAHHGHPRPGQGRLRHLQQDGQRLQIYVRLDAVGEQGFALYKLLDLGDHIGVSGYLFRTAPAS
jgi:lysyl-tRNA synthetase class II